MEFLMSKFLIKKIKKNITLKELNQHKKTCFFVKNNNNELKI